MIDGDAHDLRFLDKKGGQVVALKAKADAKTDTSGFTVVFPRFKDEHQKGVKKKAAAKLKKAKAKLALLKESAKLQEREVKALSCS